MIDCSQFGLAGTALRFSDATCAPLPFEIETVDATGLTVWVKVPVIGTASPGAILYLYGGNRSGVLDPPLPSQQVWSTGFQGVYHLEASAIG